MRVVGGKGCTSLTVKSLRLSEKEETLMMKHTLFKYTL